jgi:methionyl-tRNA formyltransferase
MDCVFFGTPDYARRVLEGIIPRHAVRLAVTQPDAPSGRGRTLTPPPVKEAALAAGIPVLAPPDLRDPSTAARIAQAGARVGVVVSYGGYLPRRVTGVFPLGCINLHPSLLPRYRGAAPVQWAVINGDATTGVSVIRVAPAMDAGPILAQEEVAVEPAETAGELLLRTVEPGTRLLLAVMDALAGDRAVERSQDDSLATFAPRLRKEDGLIRWDWPSRRIVDLVRGVNPWPGAHTRHGSTRVAVWRAETAPGSGAPGEILSADRSGILVAAGSGAVRLLTLQREGSQALPADQFLRGARWTPGQRLG